MKGPKLTRITSFLLLGDESLAEDLLELGLVVKFLNLYQLLLCLSMLMLEHLFSCRALRIALTLINLLLHH